MSKRAIVSSALVALVIMLGISMISSGSVHAASPTNSAVAESIDIAITQTPNGGTPQTYHMLADSIGFGVTNTAPTGGASGGAGAGKATFAPFTALAQTSATTPVLLQDLESQQKIDQVVVTVSTATGGKGPAMILEQFTLQLVFVTSLKQDVQVGQNVDDQLEFVFGSLKYSFENGSPV